MQQLSQQERTVPLTVLRVSVLGPLLIEYWDPPSGTFIRLSAEKWHGKGAVPALSLLELLISQPHRYGSQDWISEQLWPAADAKAAKKRLSDVVSFLRGLLHPSVSHPETLVRHVAGTKGSGGGYQLAPYPSIWVDADAFLRQMYLAALQTQMEDNPLPYLEAAYQLGARGAYLLEESYSDWAASRREEVAGAFRSCVHQLGHLYLERGSLPEAELFVRSYWTAHMTDEDALRLLMHILGRQERWSEVHNCYLQTCEMREQAGEAIDPRTHDLAEYWRSKRLSPPTKSFPQPLSVPPSPSTSPTHIIVVSSKDDEIRRIINGETNPEEFLKDS